VPDSDEGFGPLQINNYFLQNPGHVLGSHEWRKGQFGLEYSCAADPRVDLREALVAALSAITARHEGAYSAAERATSLRDQFDIT
ncbi:hypothetical protein ABTM05_19490, partial [Acinetobacter baumannii]